MTLPRVSIIGLGPGGPDLVTSGTLAEIARVPVRFGRTRRHPAASVLGEASWFDGRYETAATMDEVYRQIADAVVEAACIEGEVLYAVPGAPAVAERTVQLLLAEDRVECTLHSAMSFLECAWTRLGVDPIATSVRVVDGHQFAADAAGERGPLLVCQCDSPLVLSEIKLAVEEWPEEPIVVLQRLGLPDEHVFEVSWADLDRDVAADHLTSIFIPQLASPVGFELQQFEELVRVLRDGCPWDAEQTSLSLRKYLLEECYELLEAIEAYEPETGEGAEEFCEELGDVLFQVFFHARIAAEDGWFTIADVARTVHDKLRARHPHVFDGSPVKDLAELAVNWHAAKASEKQRDSVFDGIPAELPALLYAAKVHSRTPAAFQVPAADSPLLVDGEVLADSNRLGDALFRLVGEARLAGIDAESALREAANRARRAAEPGRD